MAFGVENPVAEYRKMKSKEKQKPAPIDRYIKNKNTFLAKIFRPP